MLRKKSESPGKNSIFKALLSPSKLPDLSQKYEGVLFQTVIRLSKKHQANMQSRRKANDSDQRQELENDRKRKSFEEKSIKQQRQIEEMNTTKSNRRNLMIREEENHIREVNEKAKQKNKQTRKKAMQQHNELTKKLENAQVFKMSRTLPHYSQEVYNRSLRLKQKKQSQQLEYSKMINDNSFEKLELSRLRLEKKEKQRKANIGKLDKQLSSIRDSSKLRQEESHSNAMQRCINLFRDSQQRINGYRQNQQIQNGNKSKRHEEKLKKVHITCKSQNLVNEKAIQMDYQETRQKISKAELQKRNIHLAQLRKHQQKKAHETQVLQTFYKQNQQYVKNKIAINQKTKMRQQILTNLKDDLEKIRQSAILDHFINRNAQSSHLTSTLLR